MAVATSVRTYCILAPVAFMTFLVCLPEVGIAYILPDTAANRARGVVGCDQTSRGTDCSNRGGVVAPDDDDTPVYTPPPVPDNELREYGRRVLRRLADTDSTGASSGFVISANSGFSELASVADRALQSAMTLKNRYYARWWSAKDNLNAWQGVSRQISELAAPLFRSEAEHETVLYGALEELKVRENQHEKQVAVLMDARASFDEMYKLSLENRLQFYQTATRLIPDLPPPSAFVRVPDGIPPYYDQSSPSVSVGHSPPGYVELMSAVASPNLVTLRPNPNDPIQPAAADRYSVRQQFGKVQSTLEQARTAQTWARLTKEDVEQAAQNADTGFKALNDLPGKLEKLRDKIQDTRRRIAYNKGSMLEIKQFAMATDDEVIAKAVEAAGWSSIEKRLISFSEKGSGLTGVVGRVNTVNTVMNDAAELARGVLGIMSEVPAAVITDPDRIPVLQEELSYVMGRFSRRLYGSILSVPNWASVVLESYLEKREWQEVE
jgi:hypothetical protein